MSTARDTAGPQDTQGADFELFRASGDVDALARVVDGVTPRLLTLAARRSRNQADAEDLVQATFLNAIEHRDRWDSSRGLMPWLVGILVHRAQNLGRRQRVRATLPLMDGEALADATVDPQHLASLEDDREAVLQAVGQLGEPYRELLHLRVEHGLDSQDLARTLGRPEGTIRVQLARGRERLEPLLPKNLRLAGLLLVEGDLVQARLRDGLLQSAGRMLSGGSKPAGAAASSALASKGWGVIAAIFVGAGLWLTLRTDSSAAAEPEQASSADEVAVALGVDGEGALTLDSLPEGASRVSMAQVPAAEPAALRVHVTRSLGAAQETVPGISVYVQPLGQRSIGQTVVTDDNGIAEFPGREPGRYSVSLGPSAADPTLVEFAAARIVELALPDGVDVSGTVVGFDGSTVAGADIYRSDLSHPAGGHWVARTDLAGEFFVTDVTPGVQLDARAAGHQPPGGRMAEHRGRVRGAIGQSQRVEIELGTRGHAVEGQVLGPNGQPAPFALIIFAVHEDARDEPNGLAPATKEEKTEVLNSGKFYETHTFLVRADAEGVYRTEEVPRGTVSIVARSWDDPSLVGATTVDVDGARLTQQTLHLQRGAEVFGTVRDSVGRPKAGVLLEAEWKGTSLLGEFDSGPGEDAFLVRTRSEADGSFVLAGLLHGRVGLSGAKGTSRFASQERVELMAGQRLEWNPVVPVHTEIRVRGLDAQGQPLVGWEVRCESSADSIRRQGALLLDDDGRARFTGLRGSKRVVTLHPPPGSSDDSPSVPALYLATEPSEEEQVLRLDAGNLCTLAGSILLPDGALRRDVDCKLQLQLEDFEKCGRRSVAFGERFRFESLPAGDYRLLVSAENVGIPRELALAEFSLRSGETLDLGELVPTLGATLVLDVITPSGTELNDRSIRLSSSVRESVMDRHFRLRRSEPGAPFRSEPLAPGSYMLSHRAEDLAVQAKEIQVRSSANEQREIWTMGAGQMVQWEIHFDREPTTEEVVPQCDPGEGRVDFSLWSETWHELWSDRVTQRLDQEGSRTMTISRSMLPGNYRVIVRDERMSGWNKPRTVQKFTVLPEDGAPIVVRLDEGH